MHLLACTYRYMQMGMKKQYYHWIKYKYYHVNVLSRTRVYNLFNSNLMLHWELKLYVV